jgi:hypothetical protein
MQTQPRASHSASRIVALIQALYYLPTGIWPLIHIRSFERLTGPKVDRWLVKTVSILIAVIGAAIGSAALRRRITPEIELLAAGSAAGLAAIDVIYVARRRIAPIYLLDALGEALLIGGWLRARGLGR